MNFTEVRPFERKSWPKKTTSTTMNHNFYVLANEFFLYSHIYIHSISVSDLGVNFKSIYDQMDLKRLIQLKSAHL